MASNLLEKAANLFQLKHGYFQQLEKIGKLFILPLLNQFGLFSLYVYVKKRFTAQQTFGKN